MCAAVCRESAAWEAAPHTFLPRLCCSSFRRGWLGGSTPVNENVGEWPDCEVYQLQGLRVVEASAPPVLPAGSVPSDAWWQDSYKLESRPGSDVVTPAASLAMEEAPEQRASRLHNALATLRAGRTTVTEADLAGGDGAASGASSMFAHGEDISGRAKARANVRNVAFDEQFKPYRLAAPPASDSLSPEEVARSTGYAAVWTNDIRAGNLGMPGQVVWGARDLDEPRVERVLNAVAERGGDSAPHEVDPLAGPPRSAGHREMQPFGWVPQTGLKWDQKNLDVDVAFSHDFPLSVGDMLPIAEAMARTGDHYVNFEQFFQTTMPPDAGFPVRFTIPFLPTITATITFTNCALDTPDASLFACPDDYEMGAYRERGFIRQM